MVQSKLTLLALAGTALAGVIRREELEDHVNPEDLYFPPPPDSVTPTPHYFEETGPSPTAFVKALSDNSREPHSTYLPSGLPSHFPQPTEEELPPFITSFPGAGEFAHTKDLAKPTSHSPAFSHLAPPGASNDGSPSTISEPVKPEEPQLNTPPPLFQASSSHPPIPYLHAETTYTSPTQPPSFTEGRPRSSGLASVKPTEPWDSVDVVKPTSFPQIPSWISHLPPPPPEITPGPEGSEKDHDTVPSALPEAYQGPPPLPTDSIPGEASEPHGSSPAGPHHTPSPGESEQEPHPPPFDFASGKPLGPNSTSPTAAYQTPPPQGSYQGPPPFNFGSGGTAGESGPPTESHHITSPDESYQPSPIFTVPGEPSQPKETAPAGPHPLPPPPTGPHHESSPPPFDSTPIEPHDPKSSSPKSYQLPSPSSHPGEADRPAEPTTSHEGPSPHYGAAPPVSCTYSVPGVATADTKAPHPIDDNEEHPRPEGTKPSPFTPPSEHSEVPHELAPSHAIPISEKPSVTLTAAYVPPFSKPEPTVTEAPSVSHAAVPRTSFN